MKNSNTLKSVIQSVNSGKQYPALSLVRKDLNNAALISKLVQPREAQRLLNVDQSQGSVNFDQSSFHRISDSIKQNIKDADNTLHLFPDIELGIQILISSIISPKDMMSNELNYKLKKNTLPAEVSSKIIEKVKEHFENYYEMKDSIQDILREALFERGSSVYAVIPESAIDEIINKRHITTEDFNQSRFNNKGFLGSPDGKGHSKTTFESLFSNQGTTIDPVYSTITELDDNQKTVVVETLKNIEVSDNIDILKLPRLIQKTRSSVVKSKFKISQENVEASSTHSKRIVKKLNEKDLERVIYKQSQSEQVEFISVKTKDITSRKTIGRPLNLKLPSESVIPVVTPGNEKEHVGYFVLVDEDGNFLHEGSQANNLSNLQNLLSDPKQGTTSYLLQRARKNLSDIECNNLSVDKVTDIYSEIINNDLLRRLKSGIYGKNVKVAKTSEVYRIMLMRTFKNQYTRLLFIPAELVTYYTFKYYPNGVGKSYLDNLKMTNSLRSILLFSRTMASVKNSIGTTEVRMKLDERDPDPQKTIEVAIHEIMKTRQQVFPVGVNTPSDLVDWLHRAGFEFTFEGHPKIPDMNLEFNQKSAQHVMPDQELEETLRKQSIMALGLSPETVDNGFNSEFATTVVANNILLSKRVMQFQNIFTSLLERHLQTLVMNDQEFYYSLVEILIENKEGIFKSLPENIKETFKDNVVNGYEELVEDIVQSIEISFPQPTVTTLENQMTAYDQYVEALDKALNAWISTEFITSDIAGDVSNYIDQIRAVLHAYFVRKWMADNNVLPELTDITSETDEGDAKLDLLQIQNDHIQGIIRSSIHFIKKIGDMKEAATKDLENLGADNASGSAYSDSNNSSDDSFDDSDDSMGSDDDSFGIDSSEEEDGGGDKEKNKEEDDSFGLGKSAF